MSARTAVAPARRMALTEAKKLNGGGDNGRARANPRCRERQPEGIGSRRTAHRVGHAKVCFGSSLEGRNRFSQNELPGIEHLRQRLGKFLAQGAVLAFQVQHGHRLPGFPGRVLQADFGVFHPSMLSAGAAHGRGGSDQNPIRRGLDSPS